MTPRDALPQLTAVNQVRVSSQLSPALGEEGTAVKKLSVLSLEKDGHNCSPAG